jgi:O-Antigen ligase
MTSSKTHFVQPSQLRAQVKPHMAALVPGLIAVGLFVLWAVQNGGFDSTTWYWGALLLLATLAVLLVTERRGRLNLSRPSVIALALFALYVTWSYLSMTWAQYPGLALDGSNRALLYLLVFALLTVLPWTKKAALLALMTFSIGVGVIAIVLLVRLAANDNVSVLFVDGRLAAPTGYINSTAALFTIQALVAIALAARRDLPAPLRGLLTALAGASLQLAVVVQSRGWLFTLPIVALVAILIMPHRLRIAAAAVIPIVAALIPVHRLLNVYDSGPANSLGNSAIHAGRPALAVCAAAFVAGTLLAWADQLYRGPGLSRGRRQAIGALLAIVAIGGVLAGGLVVSKGRPLQFISRQWRGFSHEQSASTSSQFTDVGSGRYDFWRVGFDAFLAHPIGGLGQDNFGDYYLTHRRTVEEPSWTHSLELRLLAHTGIVGFALFAGFLIAAIAAALRPRRWGDASTRMLAATMMLPAAVWLIHGSLDWFWEIPALSGPALGFLGAAGGLESGLARSPGPAPGGGEASSAAHSDEILPVAHPDEASPEADPGATPDEAPRGPRLRSPVIAAIGVLALVCATVALAFPYLSAREISLASAVSATDPSRALTDLKLASKLNPLSSDPGRIAGAIALRDGSYAEAATRFKQSISAEPGGWFSWLGAGLAASALGDRTQARHDFVVANSINDRQPAVQEALQRVDSRHPLTPAEAYKLLVLVE